MIVIGRDNGALSCAPPFLPPPESNQQPAHRIRHPARQRQEYQKNENTGAMTAGMMMITTGA
jgi:hypothetical protein